MLWQLFSAAAMICPSPQDSKGASSTRMADGLTCGVVQVQSLHFAGVLYEWGVAAAADDRAGHGGGESYCGGRDP